MSDNEKAPANQQEPSMEDILASIRRILSEDGEGKQAAAADEVADRRSAFGADMPPDMPIETAEVEEARMMAEDDRKRSEEFKEPSETAAKAVRVADDDKVSEIELADVLDLTPDMRAEPVLSPPTSAASSDALAQLAKAILDRRDVAIGSRTITLEGMVREMLRPMLKEWLDRNLPYLIERLVKKEIDLMVNRAERLED
jgi:cell pole-organizing protein PopZ